jgi:ArsR family transcriptional regulator
MSGNVDGRTAGTASQRRECCDEVDHPLSEAELASDIRALSAVGNETRYEALRLIEAADDGVCGCELEPALGVTQGAVSQALSRLYAAGLLTRRKEGRWRYYSVTARAERLLSVLDETRPATDE